jgi:drug/metabolite transporter (DMT)-like permease
MALSRLSSHGLTWMVLAQVFFAAMNVGTRMAALELPWSEIAGGMPFYALASSRIALGDAVTLGATAPIFVALLSRAPGRAGRHARLAGSLPGLHGDRGRSAANLRYRRSGSADCDTRSGFLGSGFLLGTGFAGGGAQIAMTRAYSLARAAPVTPLSGLSVVFTYLLAIPVFGDQPTAWQMVGSFLVIAASLLLSIRPAPALT